MKKIFFIFIGFLNFISMILCIFIFIFILNPNKIKIISSDSFLEEDEKHIYLNNLVKKNGKEWYISFVKQNLPTSDDISVVSALSFVGFKQKIIEIYPELIDKCNEFANEPVKDYNVNYGNVKFISPKGKWKHYFKICNSLN